MRAFLQQATLLVGVGLLAAGPLCADGFLSPDNPILVDNDGNGPDEGDPQIGLSDCGVGTHRGDYCADHPWQGCGATSAAAFEPGPDGVINDPSVVDSFNYSTPEHAHAAMVSAVDMHARPSQWQVVTNQVGDPFREGTLDMVDANADGRYESIRLAEVAEAGDFPTMVLGLVGADVDGDNFPDYASVEWSLQNASRWGVKECPEANVGPGDPIWVPVARDGEGDPAIILDIDGNDDADPQFLLGPKLALAAPVVPIPTLGEWSLLALALALLGAGLAGVRRRVC